MNRMTTQKAIEAITNFRAMAHGHAVLAEALDMAIEALSAQLDNNSTKVDNKNDELVRRQDVIKMIQETNISSGMTKARLLIKAQNLPVVQENIIRCKDCEKHESIYCTMSEEFDNGTNPEDFCSYAENTCENTCDFTRMSQEAELNDDLIRRQDALDEIEILLEQSEYDELDKSWNIAIRASINAIKHHVPSVQPERKKGEWKCSDDMYETGICTHCGWDTEEPWEECKKRYLYCPHCGDRKR